MLFLLKISKLYLKVGNQNEANELINNALKLTLGCFECNIKYNVFGVLMYLNILKERHKLELNERNKEILYRILEKFIKYNINRDY